ncbi:hypothetical protein GUJ93_ZPchr0010g7397 [Zizania palustris]|uniref:Uncharacterized protein n=1 Tax=Zizania palustris TaxID=103762 RepID=A0A8J5WA27_ZIZPA|nr:hypothetical protein GUJ93_ZPchr0010g7397 [Zizania palustris]
MPEFRARMVIYENPRCGGCETRMAGSIDEDDQTVNAEGRFNTEAARMLVAHLVNILSTSKMKKRRQKKHKVKAFVPSISQFFSLESGPRKQSSSTLLPSKYPTHIPANSFRSSNATAVKQQHPNGQYFALSIALPLFILFISVQ